MKVRKWKMRHYKLLRVFAEGGMRDALSLIDQAISYSDETVTTEDVLAVTGSFLSNT